MSNSNTTPNTEPYSSTTPSEANNEAEHLPEVLNADQVAALLHVNRKTVYAAFRRGRLPCGRRIGAAIRFHRDAVLDWLARGQEGAVRTARGGR